MLSQAGDKGRHRKLTVLSSAGPNRSARCPQIIEIPTLQEASMLWIVKHIAMTVKTGDQPSLPNMDAQICATKLSGVRKRGVDTNSHVHSSIRAIIPRI